MAAAQVACSPIEAPLATVPADLEALRQKAEAAKLLHTRVQEVNRELTRLEAAKKKQQHLGEECDQKAKKAAGAQHEAAGQLAKIESDTAEATARLGKHTQETPGACTAPAAVAEAADGCPPRAVTAETSEAEQRRRKEDKQRQAQAAERRRALKQFLHKNGFAGVNDSRRVCLLWRSYPLHVAVQKNNLRVVEMLLAEGADPCLKNSSGLTAAEVAQKNNKKGKQATMVKLLQSAAKGTACAAAAGGA